MKPMLIIAAMSCSLFLTGCMTGTMQAMVRDSGERIPMTYKQGMSHDDLVVTMPGGEVFEGKAVEVGSSSAFVNTFGRGTSSGTATMFGSMGSQFGTYTGAANTSAFSVVSSHTGNFAAVLFGDKGHTMRCQLQYADDSGLTNLGGVGVCETSDGRVVDVQW